MRIERQVSEIAIDTQISYASIILKHIQHIVIIMIGGDGRRYAAQTKYGTLIATLQHLLIIGYGGCDGLTLVQIDLHLIQRYGNVNLVPIFVRNIHISEWNICIANMNKQLTVDYFYGNKIGSVPVSGSIEQQQAIINISIVIFILK